jgi:hypothetical protein
MPSWRSGSTHGFCVTGGHPPIASEPTPSPRLWATAPGATPVRLCEHTTRVRSRPSKTGTFYLAGNRNFLFGSDSASRKPVAKTYAQETPTSAAVRRNATNAGTEERRAVATNPFGIFRCARLPFLSCAQPCIHGPATAASSRSQELRQICRPGARPADEDILVATGTGALASSRCAWGPQYDVVCGAGRRRWAQTPYLGTDAHATGQDAGGSQASRGCRRWTPSRATSRDSPALRKSRHRQRGTTG